MFNLNDNCVKVTRIFTGSEVSGCRPVMVTFESFRQREEVYKKAGMLRGTGLHISEDMTKQTKDKRNELRNYMRDVKKKDPSTKYYLAYDRLYVEDKCYKWSDEENKVIETDEQPPVSTIILPLRNSSPCWGLACFAYNYFGS